MFVQVATPSRERVGQYILLRDDINRLVGRINGDVGRIGQQPVTYLHASYPREEMAAFYRLGDVMLVTPLRDGLNLVCKEYVAARSDDDGVLVLSEFAGAASELKSAYQVRLEPLDPRHARGGARRLRRRRGLHLAVIRRPTSIDEAKALVELYLTRPDTIAWAQIDTGSGEVAGLTTYYDIDPAARTVAIGSTWLGRRFWRTGVNTEAKLLLLRHAFDDLGCARVVWHVDILNERSQVAVERIGGVREGVLRKHKLRRDGSWRDTVVFSMVDDEWPEARDALHVLLDPERRRYFDRDVAEIDSIAAVFYAWAEETAISMARMRGVDETRLDESPFADDTRQGGWLALAGYTKRRTWLHMNRPVTAADADLEPERIVR